jgi:(E)-4-hydroxy-3-methylbut-2-enyl-diphosphate synthase
VSAPQRKSRRIRVGGVPIGGDAPISVQTMTKTDTRDVEATLTQIRSVTTLGCDLVRLAVVDDAAAAALKPICAASPIPVIADIHFDYRLAIQSVEAGVACLRINPGNIGSEARIREVVAAARDHQVPIRIGVNGGSLEKDLLATHGGPTAQALVASAMRHVALLEKLDYQEIKISAKASDVLRTIETYRLLSASTDYPLHLGVTEAGTFMAGTVRSAVAMGMLLAEGIGDTIRVSLTDEPEKEVRVGLEILRSLGLREPGAAVTSCPTCGRCQVNVTEIAVAVEQALEAYYREQPEGARPHVAVMGCVVNGPGEAREADVALIGGVGEFLVMREGVKVASVPAADAVAALVAEVSEWRRSRA